MKPHIIRISVNDDFGNNGYTYQSPLHQQYGINPTQKMPNGIKSISGYEAIVDEKVLKSINSWNVVSSLLSRNFNLYCLTQEDFRKYMSLFGTFKVDDSSNDNECSLYFEDDNSYDLKYVRFINNDKRGRQYNTMDIWYQNNPINYFFLKEEGNVTIIDIGTFSKSYYVYSEDDWENFIDFINRAPSIQEIRDIKISQILNEKPSVYANLLRQVYFRNKYKSPSNSFLESVYTFYEKNGFITDKQAKAVMKEIW